MKPQVQAPRTNHINPNGDVEDKTAHGDDDSTGDHSCSSSSAFPIPNIDVTSITNHSSSDCNHPHNPTSISNGSKCKLVYNPGGHHTQTQDRAKRGQRDSTSPNNGNTSRTPD